MSCKKSLALALSQQPYLFTTPVIFHPVNCNSDMGIFDLLQHLPGGTKNDYHHSFYELGVEHGLKGGTVPLDAASVLWQLAARHARDYIDGNYTMH